MGNFIYEDNINQIFLKYQSFEKGLISKFILFKNFNYESPKIKNFGQLSRKL